MDARLDRVLAACTAASTQQPPPTSTGACTTPPLGPVLHRLHDTGRPVPLPHLALRLPPPPAHPRHPHLTPQPGRCHPRSPQSSPGVTGHRRRASRLPCPGQPCRLGKVRATRCPRPAGSRRRLPPPIAA
jgi:hypothetical protein